MSREATPFRVRVLDARETAGLDSRDTLSPSRQAHSAAAGSRGLSRRQARLAGRGDRRQSAPRHPAAARLPRKFAHEPRHVFCPSEARSARLRAACVAGGGGLHRAFPGAGVILAGHAGPGRDCAHRGGSRPQRGRPHQRPAPQARADARFHRNPSGHDRPGCERGWRLYDRTAGARDRAQRCGLWPEPADRPRPSGAARSNRPGSGWSPMAGSCAIPTTRATATPRCHPSRRISSC